jgi:aminoglycoside phosphotransferase (APT) family kinase protein
MTEGLDASIAGLTAAPDRARLSEHLARTLPQLGVVREIERLPGGLSNPTWLVRCEHAAVILRAKPAPASNLLPSAHAIEREYAVMQALGGAGFPVPRMLSLCMDESVLGVAFYLMERVDGRILRDATLPGESAAGRAAIYDAMSDTVARLHAIDPAAVGLDDFGAAGNYLERQIGRWTRQYKASETEPIAAMDALLDWLPRHVPASAERRIVHGDFRMENLILDPAAPRVLAVIDWELSTVGDPLADFAYHCLPWHMPPGASKGIAGLDHAALGIPSEAAYRARYTERTGRAIDATWPVYIAFNFFRLAAILQGVYRRALDGKATSEKGLAAGARARAMAELGWSHARRL